MTTVMKEVDKRDSSNNPFPLPGSALENKWPFYVLTNPFIITRNEMKCINNRNKISLR